MVQMQKGHLKIFFSYAESIGKTHTMLKAAHAAQEQGIDVVVGFVASHTSEETFTLLEGLEQLKPLVIDGREEFDLDLALNRKPSLILVDELAHTNGKGCRHHKRYQDIEELQNAGIDVYTTVNVGNIESLHDSVVSIIGSSTWDRIPDMIFDHADQVELIDIEPPDLIERLKEEGECGKITVGQLAALREMALRRCADRVKLLSEKQQTNSYRMDEHILACLSSAPSNARIIRTAARMARAFNSQFTALFVETSAFSAETEDNKKRLQANRKLAAQLGANIETVYGEDVPYQIAEFARVSGITKIVLGQSAVTRRHLLGKPTLTEQLISYVPGIDIHIIPDQNNDSSFYYTKTRVGRNGIEILKNIAKSAGILFAATQLSLLFYKLGFTDANIIMVYLLGVLITSIVTSKRIYSLSSSVASVTIFNYLFTTPRFSLTAYETGYPVTFVVMFFTAFITATFANRYKEQARQAARVAHRTKILFDTDQMLSKAGDRNEVFQVAAEQVAKLLGRDIIIFDAEDGKLSELPKVYSGTKQAQDYDIEKERKTAEWVMKNNHYAGATTDTMSDASYMYLALRVNERVYGVVGIEAEQNPLDVSEHEILLSILGECALALENMKNAKEKETAAILAKSEQLRANLLRTISHDLRTPLTSISGNANNLLNNGERFDNETKKQIYSDIYDDSMWLISLVENLLSATRFEEGRMQLRISTELLSDIVEEAVHHVNRRAREYQILVNYEDDLLLVKADAKLIVQVIINIIDNAIKYTPSGSRVIITTQKEGQMANIKIADDGPGIADEEKEKIFEKFYSGTNKIADNRRSLGLGLYLCKAIIEAHGGTIHVSDNQPKGTIFDFTLPLKEVTLHG